MRSKKKIFLILLLLIFIFAFSVSSFAAASGRNLPCTIVYDSGTDQAHEMHYTYNEKGLFLQVISEENGLTDRKDYKYTYNDDGSIKKCKVTESRIDSAKNEKTVYNIVTYMFNEYGIIKSAKNAAGDYKLSAAPTYYTGTHKVKTLQVTEKTLWDDEWESVVTTFYFNKNGYLTKKKNRAQSFTATYDSKGRVTAIMNAKYKYALKDNKIWSMKRYWSSNGNYIDATVFKDWISQKMDADTVRSARIFYTIRTMSMQNSGDILGKENPRFIYEWK